MLMNLNLTEEQCDELLCNTFSQTSFYMVNAKLVSIYGFPLAGFMALLMNKFNFFRDQGDLTPEGFYLTDDYLHTKGGFEYSEIKKYKKRGQELGFFTVKKIGTPSKTYYKINSARILSIISTDIPLIELGYKRVLSGGSDIDIDNIRNFEDFNYKELQLLCKRNKISYSGNDKKIHLIMKLKKEFGILETNEKTQWTENLSTSGQEKHPLEKMDSSSQWIEKTSTSEQKIHPLEEIDSSDTQWIEKASTSGQESCHNINIIYKYNNMTCHGDEKNKKEKDSEIEKIFHELGINYTDTNEIYTSKILEALDGNKEFLKIYLERVYKEISKLSAVKNIAALFSAKIKEINYSLIENIKNKNKLKEKEIQETRKKEEKVREIIEEHVIKKETIEYFLTLDKEIQKDIVEESERNYFKMHPEVKDLEIFKKASYSLYLQLIYKELICVIEKNYPELSVESKKRYEILS